MRRVLMPVRLLVLLSACSSVVPVVDGGRELDASVVMDAGATVDASVVVDASVPDASVVVDASVPDASVVVDASVPDASVVVDASVPDASVVLPQRFEITAAGARLTAGTMVMDVQLGPPLVRQPLTGGTLTLTPLPPVAK